MLHFLFMSNEKRELYKNIRTLLQAHYFVLFTKINREKNIYGIHNYVHINIYNILNI